MRQIPGEKMSGRPVELSVLWTDGGNVGSGPRAAHQRAMMGDATLFARQDVVEAAGRWSIRC
jgi:hypothetical protein